MRTVKGEGSYTRKADNADVAYSFEYKVLESLEDMSEAEILALCNRMLKVDGNNTSREKAKVANGDSTARILTAEEKEARKAGRKADSELLKALKAKGMTLEDLQALLK